MEIKNITKFEWIRRWAGSFSFLSCSHWAKQYKEPMKRDLGVWYDHPLFIHRKGAVTFYLTKEDFEKAGKFFVEKTKQDEQFAISWLDVMKKNTDDIMSVMKKLKGKIPTREEYDEFNHYFEKHIAPQNVMKKTVDFMPPEMLSKLIDKFKEARIYSEPVYSESERFFRELANTIGKKEGYNGDYLTCLSQDELEDYIDNKKLPSEDVLKQRFEASAILYENGEVKIVVGKDVDLIEQNLMNKENENEVKGVVAFNGKVQGVCRIVWDPLNPGEFNEGDVLVTGMTRPEFVPLMEKSSAIVTDVGGILCHAAIVSREMKKPCIIGTKIATKIFKSGDKLEVDAINGIVRKV